MKTKQQGFTLIELIVVIVILGILSATALPKFLDMGKDARGAVVQATEGAMRSANSMLYAKAAASGLSNNATAQNVTINGGTVSVLYGFAADATELAKVMDLDPSKLVSATAGVHYIGLAVGTCGVTYTAATATAAPGYATVVTGC